MNPEKKQELKAVPVQDKNHEVILFNCDCHSFDTVVVQLMKATGCTEMQAVMYADVAEQFGLVTVFYGSREACIGVAKILASIALDVKVQ
jgi:ATP-dependent Clp protease adaptor protein ClpS